uniref:Uncharacterized protein n=1 Tax=Lepeophtheirus salmonis TaxID=72036 RepID=A0A0K2USA1_LEPSM
MESTDWGYAYEKYSEQQRHLNDGATDPSPASNSSSPSNNNNHHLTDIGKFIKRTISLQNIKRSPLTKQTSFRTRESTESLDTKRKKPPPQFWW